MSLPFASRAPDSAYDFTYAPAAAPARRLRLAGMGLAGLLLLGLAGAGARGWLAEWAPPEDPAVATATLSVASEPPGATIVLDGRARGRTPATLRVTPGPHRLALQRDDAIGASRQVEVPPAGSALSETHWRRQPDVLRLRPTYPGASIAAASFLRDGRVALALALPPGDERQAWLFDPTTTAWTRVGPRAARTALAVAPDGGQVAFLSPAAETAGERARVDTLWLIDAAGGAPTPRYTLPAEAPNERLADVTWAPDGAHLLLAVRVQVPGGPARTRLLWLDRADGAPRELVLLPSEVVPGSAAWSPDGARLALLARTDRAVALCLLDVDAGAAFRYLADVERSAFAAPLPFPPVAWSPDGRQLLYAAPSTGGSGGWPFQGGPTAGLFRVDLDRPAPERLGEAQGRAPVWRSDGTILTLARSEGERLAVRTVAPDGGSTQDVAALPLRAGGQYAARWEAAHARALIATRGGDGAAGETAYWLVRFAWPEGRR